MNIKRMVAFSLVGAVAMTGCVSVESTKMQLQSGNPELISQAEENIYRIAIQSRDYSTKERIDYINLTSNQDVLMKIFSHIWHDYYKDDVCIAVVKRMNFSKKDSIISFIEKNKEFVCECDDRIKPLQKEIVSAMLSTATVDELMNAGKYLTSHYMCFYELCDPLAMKLANVVTDQEVLFQLVDGTSSSHPLCIGGRDDSFRDVALAKLTDQKKLMSLYCNYHCYAEDKVLAKLEDATICNFILNDPRYKDVSKRNNQRDNRKLIARIKDKKLLVKILIAKEDDSGAEGLFDSIKDEKNVARIIVDAKNANIREMAAKRLKSREEIISILMNDSMTNEVLQLALVNNIEDGSADVRLYDGVKNPIVRDAVVTKLSKEARIEIRSRNKSECEQLIANAKGKGSETFELAGFYLGMNIGDAEKLIGYYFPDFLTTRKSDSDGDGVLYVSNQKTPFCYADKSGKVYQFNFGKVILKKWYKYDIQTFMEWARKYSREMGIDMRFKTIEKDTTVYEPMDMSRSYKVWFHQESYQYKHNAKGYRLIYFGEEKDFTFESGIGGAIIKEMAAPRFRYVRGDPGSLRVSVEND